MNTKNQALAQELADYATSLRSASMAIQLEGRNAPTSFLRCADLCERAATALKCADSAPHAGIHIDFAQIGTAGPFPVENGRVSLPDVTMVDSVQRLKPTINAMTASAPAVLPEPKYTLMVRGVIQSLAPTAHAFGMPDGEYNIFTEQQRPSAIFRPRLSIDGDKWCALYGDNLQDGVSGFGDTPDQAMRDFDAAWGVSLSAQLAAIAAAKGEL